MNTNTRSLALVAMLATVSSSHAQQPRYDVQPLGEIVAWGINASAAVAGRRLGPMTTAKAVLIEGGTVQTIGQAASAGLAVNDSGQVTGYAARQGQAHAVIFRDGTMKDLDPLQATASAGLAINASGQVTGYTNTGKASRPFLFSDGTMTQLGTAQGAGQGINERGEVTGWTMTGAGTAHAVIFRRDEAQDLGTLGGPASEGRSINASGHVTGYAETAANVRHAFVFHDGTMRDLGTLGGTASEGRSINASGQVTGYAETGANVRHAFVFDHGHMIDLNTASGKAAKPYTLGEGVAINDRGQIVAQGTIKATGKAQAFLLTPR
jgi:probable HAF family extracellular repeat protein